MLHMFCSLTEFLGLGINVPPVRDADRRHDANHDAAQGRCFAARRSSVLAGKLYRKRHHDDYLKELDQDGPRRRAEYLYQELDSLQKLRCQMRHELIVACRKHPAAKWLQSVPFLGPLRTAVLIGRVKTPHRFRSKRQFWGLLRTSAGDSRQRRILRGQRAGGTQKEAGIGARIELEP
jgi:hypothetical protein